MRVVRFEDTSEPEPDRAAPVARFGEDLPAPAPGEIAAADVFDHLDAPAVAPVAPLGPPDRDPTGGPADGPHEIGPPPAVVDLAGLQGAPATVFRAAELTGLAPGGRRRRSAGADAGSGRAGNESAAPVDTPDPAEPIRRGRRTRGGGHDSDAGSPAGAGDPAAGDPAAGDVVAAEPRGRGRGARRGGGGFGNRGRPAELDPDADPIAVAKEICLRLLTDRARTRQELAQALTRKGVPDEAAESVLERFDEVGLIDDAAFAGQWVRSRHHHRGLARRAIAMELRRKGVDDEVASEALEEVDQDSEERRARELVDRKLRTVPADTPEQRTKAATRLVGMLARKGYGGGIAYRVVREALAAHGAEIDELGTGPFD